MPHAAVGAKKGINNNNNNNEEEEEERTLQAETGLV
jgi:hypothetical protein